MDSARRLAIRRAAASDAGPIRELVRAAYAKWVPIIGREPLPMQADYHEAVRKHRIDLLFADQALAGLIEMVLHPDHLWIENVAVSPARHGEGLGRRLLAHAEEEAAAAGLAELRLLTNAAFEANVALYERLGYEVEKREPFVGGVTVYMRKSTPLRYEKASAAGS